MSLRVSTLPTRYTRAIVLQAQLLGMDVKAALTEVGLELESFTASAKTISIPEVDTLLQLVATGIGREDIGIDVGMNLGFTAHGMLGFGMAHCETLDQALRLGARYNHLMWQAFTFEYHRDKVEARICFRPNAAMSPRVFRCIGDIFSISMYQHLNELLGDALPQHELLLWGERPAHARRFDALSRAHVRFSGLRMPEVQYVLPGTMLDTRLPSADRKLVQIAENHCRKCAPPTGPNGRWSDWITLMLSESVSIQPSIEKLAEMLHITPRTLNRHLANEGESFRDMAKQVRLDRARRWLAGTDKPIADIASLLGYSDVAGFSHAFRSLNGISPSTYREQARSDHTQTLSHDGEAKLLES